MATAIVTPAMRRKAEQLAELVPTFHRGRSKANGQGFYLVPGSQPGTAHYTSDLGCTCPGFRHRGVCAHQQACVIVLARQTATRIAAAQPPVAKSAQQIYAEAGPFGPCAAKGCDQPAVGKMRKCGPHFDALLKLLANE